MTNSALFAYGAGPCVFYPNPTALADIKRKISAKHGITFLFPLDGELSAEFGDRSKQEQAQMIFEANKGLIRKSQLVLANLEPFRGPGMDAGTAWEVGFANALGLPVFGYSSHTNEYKDRVADARLKDGRLVDEKGLEIENLSLCENLMIQCTLVGGIVHPSFEAAVRAAQAYFAEKLVTDVAA